MDKIDNRLQQLYDAIGKNLKSRIIKILVAKGKVASGNLISSIEINTGVSDGSGFIDLFMADYAIYVDQGRKPGKQPPIQSILEWTRLKGIPDSAAYPIARSIALNGIPATNFIEEAVTQIEKEFQEELSKFWLGEYGKELEKQIQLALQ
jgi:hypothetical protein